MLSQFASSGAALGLLLISLTAFLLLKDRRLARRLPFPVVLLFLFLGMNALATWSDVSNPMMARGLRVTALIFFAFASVRVIAVVIVDWFLRTSRGVEIPKIVRDILVAALYGFAAMVIVRTAFDIDLAAFFTSAALLSVVIGLGLQDTLGGVFAGLALQMEPPFAIGDWVTFGHTTAKVSEVSWRVTRLVTRSGDLVVVPNAIMAKTELVNHSRPTRSHVRYLDVGLPYDVAPSVVKSVITQAIANVPGVLPEPAPGVRIKRFADSAIEYTYYFFIEDFQKVMTIEADAQSALWYALRRAEIAIPFPIRTVFMHQPEAAPPDETVFRDAEKLLEQVDFLKMLDEDVRRGLARRMRAVKFGAGETIVLQGDQGETFYIVAEGEVNVALRGQDNVERKLGQLHRGNFFGEMSLLTGEPRSATVVANADTLLLAIERDGFRDTLLQHPEVAKQLAEILSHRASQIAAAHADSAAAQTREQGRILGRLRELFKLS